MRGKLLFAAGLAAGYVIGTRQGRQAYEKLKRQAADVWSSPRVQDSIASAQDAVKERVPVVGSTLAGAVGKVTSAVDGAADSARRGSTPLPAPASADGPES